jgi:hypothetical protein
VSPSRDNESFQKEKVEIIYISFVKIVMEALIFSFYKLIYRPYSFFCEDNCKGIYIYIYIFFFFL